MSWSIFSSGSGTNAKSWATAFLNSINAPVTNANLQSVIAWMIQEGGGGQNNPLNTTQSTGVSGVTGTINSAGVKNYASLSDGIQATTLTIENGSYPTLLSDLRSGNGIGNSAAANQELQTWGTGSWQVSIGQHLSQAASDLNETVAAITGATGSSSTDTSGLLGDIPGLSQIVTFFEDADKVVIWLTKPSDWMRILAFIAGVGLFLFAIHAFIAAANGEPIIKAPSAVPVPVPL